MRVDPALVFPPPTEPVAAAAKLPPEDAPRPVPGHASTPENRPPAKETLPPETAQDEVKLQWDSENQIRIYRFLNHRGELVMQVPSEQMVNLAREIQQQLLQEAAHRAAGVGGGKRQ